MIREEREASEDRLKRVQFACRCDPLDREQWISEKAFGASREPRTIRVLYALRLTPYALRFTRLAT